MNAATVENDAVDAVLLGTDSEWGPISPLLHPLTVVAALDRDTRPLDALEPLQIARLVSVDVVYQEEDD